MSITNLQNKPIIVGTPIEIEKAVNEIRLELAKLPWLEKPYFIAHRFFRQKNNRQFVYPETYVKEVSTDPKKKYAYKRLTPDNDFKGMSFFLVGDESNDFNANKYNYLKYPVGIIFSVNLELIDKAKLDAGIFTQELIRDVRRVLTESMILFDFQYTIDNATRDLRRVFREFVLDDLEAYNRAPMQCFRFDLTIELQEECP